MRFLAVLALCLLTFTFPADAAPTVCNAGAEGTIIYNKDYKIVQFCNGAQWIGMVARIGGTGDTLADLSCTSGEIVKFNGAAWACAADDAGTSGLPALASAKIWVGDGSNAATAVAMSGDATISNTGVLMLGTGAVGSTEITDSSIASADIAADTIVAADIAAGAVGTSEIADGSITAADTAIVGTLTEGKWCTVSGGKIVCTSDAPTGGGGGGGTDRQVFTSSGTWNKPALGNFAFIECWGGGGSGARSISSSYRGSPGGGGGGYSSRLIPTVSLPASVAVTIGAGGAAATTSPTAGNPGGNTTFGSFLTAYGGRWGSAPSSSGNAPYPQGGLGGGPPGAEVKGSYTEIDDLGSTNTIFAESGGYYGGGGGDGGTYTSPTKSGGSAQYGGGGGGMAYRSNGATAGGSSAFAGAGGAGGFNANGTDGGFPAGGGGGCWNGSRSGAGAGGRCIVTVW